MIKKYLYFYRGVVTKAASEVTSEQDHHHRPHQNSDYNYYERPDMNQRFSNPYQQAGWGYGSQSQGRSYGRGGSRDWSEHSSRHRNTNYHFDERSRGRSNFSNNNYPSHMYHRDDRYHTDQATLYIVTRNDTYNEIIKGL